MTTKSTITPSMSIALILMVARLQKTRKRILGHPRKKGARGPLTTEQTSTTKEEASQAEDVAVAETHSSLSNVCTMAMIPTTTRKIAPYSSNPKRRWSKVATNLCINPHPEK
jgi:hypothetical protein